MGGQVQTNVFSEGASVDAPAQTVFSQSALPDFIENLGIDVSVAAGAATVAIKRKDGTSDPISSDVTKIAFRLATLATGGYSILSISSALSMVVTSGATLGTVSAVKSRIYVHAINNSGTPEVALSGRIWPSDELVSTTAMSSGADSASVLYSTTARSNVPVQYLGEFDSTQATAGTWASEPTKIFIGPQPKKTFDIVSKVKVPGDTYEEGVWYSYDSIQDAGTSGFGSIGGAQGQFMVMGKICYYHGIASGTSNSTSFKVDIPIQHDGTGIGDIANKMLPFSTDNGSAISTSSVMMTTADPGFLQLRNNNSSTGWTASGTKGANLYYNWPI